MTLARAGAGRNTKSVMVNKIYKLKIRAVDRGVFDAIKSGRKKIETRAAIENYRKIKKGDTVIFVCEGKKIKRKVVNVALYKDIGVLFKNYKIKDVFASLKKISEVRKMYYSFPNYREKIKKFGLIILKLK